MRISEFSFTRSPALRWFGHKIGADGTVPAEDVQIYWSNTRSGRVANVAVVYFPIDDIHAAGRANAHPVWNTSRGIDIIYDKGKRCKFHGGMSTGPKTQQGREVARKRMIAMNAERSARKHQVIDIFS